MVGHRRYPSVSENISDAQRAAIVAIIKAKAREMRLIRALATK